MGKSIDEHMKRFGFDRLMGGRTDKDAGSSQEDGASSGIVSESSSSLIKALTGSIGVIGDFYFPPDMIGGTCPRIAGDEEELVWNAAAEACDTERVHVIWQSFENRVWYLAVRSSDLASQPNSWCPLASLLPSMKDAATPPVCYTYFGEETAVLMIVMSDALQVFRGTGPVVRAKAERTARELGDAPIVNLDHDRIEQLTPAPWYSMSLFEDRARRVLATLSVLVSLVVTGASFLVWLLANMAMVATHHDLSDALRQTRQKSLEMVRIAEGTRTSPLREQIRRFLDVNDGLLDLNGYLDVYEIKNGTARWRAVVPPSATAARITALGGQNIETSNQGVVIGNRAEVVYEAQQKR
ncbi:MAG: hypothetical protein KGI97_06990 [Alphaproteobacteria bacterium]|nr:hypothetical protein [Alphaproteobacteria bacterium]